MGQEKVQKNSKNITDYELYKELIKLNFSKQYMEYSKSIEKNLAALIMLYGQKDTGIQMLKEKIVNPILNPQKKQDTINPQENQDITSINPLPVIELNGSEGIISSDGVWQKLANCVEGYEKKNQPLSEDEITAKITGACRERSLVIIFNIYDEIPLEFLKEIIDNFCNPLLNSLNKPSPYLLKKQLTSNKLLMLFLNLNHKEQLYIVADERICKLTPTDIFTPSDIESWIMNAEQQFTRIRLPETFSLSEADKIYSDSKEGNPRLVYKNIYQLFDITWTNSEVHRRVG